MLAHKLNSPKNRLSDNHTLNCTQSLQLAQFSTTMQANWIASTSMFNKAVVSTITAGVFLPAMKW